VVLASTATATLPRWLGGAIGAAGGAFSASVGFGIGALVTPSSIAEESVNTPYVFYHGTARDSALELLAGAPLQVDVAAALQMERGSLQGFFFLAEDWRDAEYFALRRQPGLILQYTLSSAAVNQLVAAGAFFQPIPGRLRAYGGEFVVPPGAFPAFNALRVEQQISVTLFDVPD
jgi:hypothetical protein